MDAAATAVGGGLVARGVEHRRVVLEDVLRAVPVMHVEIDNCDALGAVFPLRLAGDDGNGIDEAEAHRPLEIGVMARRAHRAKGVAHFPHGDRLERQQPTADGCRRRIHGPGRDEGVLIDLRDPFGRPHPPQIIEVVRPVDKFGELQVAGRRVLTHEGNKAVGRQCFLDRANAFGTLGVPGRGHVALVVALADEQCAQAVNLAAFGLS
jgi:hypothetical protein